MGQHAATGLARAWRGPFFVILCMAAATAALLAGPGRTVTTAYVNDLFIFLDGAHRVASGQVPNRDFHTALGPLVYYIPAVGLLLSGQLGGAMPVGIAMFLLLAAPVVAHVLTSRLEPIIALPFAAFLLLIVAAPMNLGEGVTSLSFAMFYNRLGWVLLATLLVMTLPSKRPAPRQLWPDALSAAFLVGTMLYMKISYGLVGLAYLAILLTVPAQRPVAAMSLAITAAAILVVEVVWGSSAAHLADIALAGQVSGGLRSLEDLTNALLRHLGDYASFALVAGLAVRRTRSMRDVVVYAFCAASGLALLLQNSQPWGIVTLQAGAVIGAETLMRSAKPVREAMQRGGTGSAHSHRSLSSVSRAAAPLLVLALLLPTIVHCALGLALHTGLAIAEIGRSFGLRHFERISLPRLWIAADHDFFTRYLASIEDGARALSRLPSPSHVFVLDFANPFSAGLNFAPPRGDTSWLHWGRNLDDVHFLAPETLLRDVRIVMQPKWGINVVPLQGLYGAYIAEHFDVVSETGDWTVHLARRGSAPDRLDGRAAQSAAARSGESAGAAVP
jgi:hypothetical protein